MLSPPHPNVNIICRSRSTSSVATAALRCFPRPFTSSVFPPQTLQSWRPSPSSLVHGRPKSRVAVESSATATTPSTASGSCSSGDSPLLGNIKFHRLEWYQVESEQQFFAFLEEEVKAGRFPKQLVAPWQDFYNNYRSALLGSKQPGANEKLVAQVQASIADNVMLQLVRPYTFPSFHQRLVDDEGYNYYDFGQRYVASLIDFSRSYLGHKDRWDAIADMVARKENVVLLANHQTEADPGVFAHMLATSHPNLATDVIYVAGDRVVTDPMCKPFSMGRNLFCVHSKKHINDIPELYAQKAETNRKTLVAMSRKLNEGGALIWIAPSGGRDRTKIDGEFYPDAFDPSAVELMRNLGARAKRPTHLFPMAMYSWPMMPPPDKIEKSIGERRVTNWTPVGIAVGEELQVDQIIACSGEDKEAQQAALAIAAWQSVKALYGDLLAAIKDPSNKGKEFVQPWL